MMFGWFMHSGSVVLVVVFAAVAVSHWGKLLFILYPVPSPLLCDGVGDDMDDTASDAIGCDIVYRLCLSC